MVPSSQWRYAEMMLVQRCHTTSTPRSARPSSSAPEQKYRVYFTECQSNAAKTRKLTLVKDTPETVKCQNEIF